MEAPEWVENLFKKRSTHMTPGIDTIKHALNWIEPGNHKNILIAGTNGKGSVANDTYRLLQVLGKIVGLFTSPHVFCFSERFQVSGQKIPLEELEKRLDDIRKKLPDELVEQLSFFELSVLLAIECFKENHCDYVIWEVGLGGRLDATNALTPDCCVVTSIDLDHQKWLGNTLEAIAFEKLGIRRKGIPLVWGEPRASLERYAKKLCSESGTPFYPVTKPENIPSEVESRPLHLQKSFSMALQVVKQLGLRFSVDGMDRFESIANAPSYFGRCQRVFWGKSEVWLDVCHNPAAARKFAEFIGNKRIKIPILLSVLDDKDFEGIHKELLQIATKIEVFQSQSIRCNQFKGRSLSNILAEMKNDNVNTFAVCGSFQAVADAMTLMKEHSNLCLPTFSH